MDGIPNLFKKLVAAINAPLYEDSCSIRVDQFSCHTPEVFESLQSLVALCEQSNLGACLVSGEILRDVNPHQIGFDAISRDTLNLVVHKTVADGFHRFLTVDGLGRALTNQEFIRNAKRVQVAEAFSEFSSLTCTFSPWDAETPNTAFSWQGLADPRKLVRDLSLNPDLTVPQDIRPWLLRSDQNLVDSSVLRVWEAASACNLCFVLPSEIRSSDGENLVAFRGERLREVKVRNLDDVTLIGLFPVLNEGAEWIYLNQQDAEIKHTLLNHHLAFEWTSEEDWPQGTFIARALASARESYRLHLLRTSQELLKAYGEIKKALLDEVEKVSENTRGVITNFWRDFAIAAGVIAIRFLSTNDLSPEGITILYCSTAAFLIVSLLITVVTNAKFNELAEANRTRWYARLYPFIDQASLDELVGKPIEQGLNTYAWVVYVTLVIYLVISAYLLRVGLPAF